MTKQEYENAIITTVTWTFDFCRNSAIMLLNGRYKSFYIEELLIPMYRAGFIEGYKDGMLVVQKIDIPGETELVDVDAFMTQNVDIAFCESILKYL